jgi:hypothetical protein
MYQAHLEPEKLMSTLEKLEELIYKGFKETDDRLAKQRQETEELFAKQRRETDALLAKHRQEIEARSEKERKGSDERFERMHRETQREIDKVAKQLGGVTESLSRFSEQMVVPATKRLFSKRGIELNRISVNFEEHLNGETMETDVIGTGPECAVLIEVKLRLRKDDIEELLEKKLPRFFEFFPYFRRPILYGGVAGMSIDKDVDRFAYKHGLFVIAQTGDNLKILNDKKFKPRSFYTPPKNGRAKRKANHKD